MRQIAKDSDNIGVIIFDDTIQAKLHTDELETIRWHYDHSIHRNVKGINILNCLCHMSGIFTLIAYEIVTKPKWFSDIQTKKTKRNSTKTKNETLRRMFYTLCLNQVRFRYVLMDSWFTSKENLVHIRKRYKRVMAALKAKC